MTQARITVSGDTIGLEGITLTDASLARFVGETPEDERPQLVERALRIGLLTLCNAGVSMSADVVKAEFERLYERMETAMALATDRLIGVSERQPELASALRELLAHRSRVRKPGGGWVLDSFWSAWEAFAAAASYRDTVERAVKYGNDTDTTAAIAGGLAGIRWSLDESPGGIPAEWLEALRGKHIVEEILAKKAIG